MKSIFLFIITFLLCGLQTFAYQTQVYGVIQNYPDSIIYLRYYDDEITRQENILATALVQENGSFNFSFHHNLTRKCYIDLGVYRGVLFVEPGKTYPLQDIPYVPKSDAQLFNVFFTPQELLIPFKNTPTFDINQQILDFELAVDEVWAELMYDDLSKEFVTEKINQLEKSFPSNNDFFKTYKQSTYAQLANLHLSISPYWGITDFMVPLKVEYNNPAYWEAFFVLFEGYLNRLERVQAALPVFRAYQQADWKAMRNEFSAITEWNNPPLEELVLIYNLMEHYNSKPALRKQIISLLEQIYQTSNYTENKKIAQGVLANLQRAQVGSKVPNFVLQNLKDENFSIKDLEGKYVYVVFASSRMTETKADLVHLEQIYKRFSDNLSIVFIFVHESPKTTKEYLNNMPTSLIIANWNNNSELMYTFGVKNIPSYYLIDREGYFVHSPALSPARGFERKMSAIIEMEKASENASKMNRPFFNTIN